MGYVKAILAVAFIIISGHKFHKYEEEHNGIGLGKGLLWWLIGAIVIILIAAIPS